MIKNILPAVSLSEKDDYTLRMQNGKYWLDLYLGNFHINYLSCPNHSRNDYLMGVLRPFIEDLARGRGVNAQDIATDLDRIYPLVVGPEDLDDGIITTALASNLHLVYVYDQGLRFFYLDKPILSGLKMDMPGLHQLATRNFYQDMDKPLLVIDKKRGVLGYNYLDSYDSTRVLLLIKKFGGIEELLGEDVLVMVPNRDLAMIFANRDEAIYNRIKILGRSEYISHPYPVSGNIFKLIDSKLVDFDQV